MLCLLLSFFVPFLFLSYLQASCEEHLATIAMCLAITWLNVCAVFCVTVNGCDFTTTHQVCAKMYITVFFTILTVSL